MAINKAKDFKLEAELNPVDDQVQRIRLGYHENMRQAILILLEEVATLREEVNQLKGQ